MMYARGTCHHKTLSDHSWLVLGERVWKCTNCGHCGRWADGWAYFGNIECTTCWTASIDSVSCPDCRTGPVIDEAPKARGRRKKP